MHELLKGSEVLAALRREIDVPDDVQGVRTWVIVLGRSVGTLPGILKPSALIIEGEDSLACLDGGACCGVEDSLG